MQNVKDVDTFQFSDLETIISNALSGKLLKTKEKNDGQNLLISWIDGEFRAARNGSHIKNFGKNSMTVSATKSMFAGRGTIETAFSDAVGDISKAISNLTAKQQEKIFMNGKKFMSVEVQHSANPNVVHYGNDTIVLQGTLEYDEAGKPISQFNIEDARILSGMLQQVRATAQNTFEVKAIKQLALKKLPNFAQLKKKFTSDLRKVRSRYGLSNSATISEYKESYWREQITRNLTGLEKDVEELLINRWAHFIKRPSIVQIAKMSKLGSDIRAMDKNHTKLAKNADQPIEDIFLQVGARVMEGMTEFMSVNPEFSSSVMTKNLKDAIAKIEASGNEAAIAKLRSELARLDRIGIERIVPSEGITFFVRKGGEDILLKLTGAFAPLNQINSILWQL